MSNWIVGKKEIYIYIYVCMYIYIYSKEAHMDQGSKVLKTKTLQPTPVQRSNFPAMVDLLNKIDEEQKNRAISYSGNVH